MDFNRHLHALRGIAATAVLVFHWYQFFPAAAEAIRPVSWEGTLLDPTIYLGFGWMGVPLFFVLSGYLLGGQVLGVRLDGTFLKRFWLRRFLRIYPAVWAELLILLALGTFITGLISAEGMATLPLQFLLWINLPPFMAQPINGVWWTLPVELGFYLLLPFLGLMARWANWVVLLAAAVLITVGWRAFWFAYSDVETYLSILPVLDSLPGVLLTFSLGFSLNFLTRSLSVSQRRWGVILCLIGLLALMQWQLTLDDVYWSGHWILVVWPPMVAICIAGLVFFFENPSPEWQWLGRRFLVWLGHVSFGIYLWHFQVMRVLVLIYPDQWSTPAKSLLALAISLTTTLILAALSYYLIEKPLMGWGKKYTAS